MKDFSAVSKKSIRLKHLFPIQITGAWGEDPIDGEGVVCLRAADILTDRISHSIKNLTRRSYSDHDINTKTLKKGDLIIEKSGGGEKQPVGRVVRFCLDEPALCSNFLSILRPDGREILSDFGAYLLYSLWDCREVERHIKQTTGIQNLDNSSYLDVQISLPPIDFQRIAVGYLDRETTEIDTLVAEKEQMITLLEENREVLIRHTVTRGLNANASCKSSGLDWLGDIPEHWEVSKIKYLTKILRGKFSHRPRNDPKLYDGEYPFIQTGDVTNANKFITGYTQTLNEDGYAVSKEFPSGTLVMTIAANIGDMAILDFNACFPDSIVGFLPYNRTGVLFLYYLFVSMRKQFLSTAVMNTQLNLNIERISNLITVIPPLNEQLEIINFLDKEIQKIDRLSASIQKSIALLKERRSALITAAVTGQIELETMNKYSLNSEVSS